MWSSDTVFHPVGPKTGLIAVVSQAGVPKRRRHRPWPSAVASGAPTAAAPTMRSIWRRGIGSRSAASSKLRNWSFMDPVPVGRFDLSMKDPASVRKACSGRDGDLEHAVTLVGEQLVRLLDLIEREPMRHERTEVEALAFENAH